MPEMTFSEDTYEDIARNAKTRFKTSSYEIDRPLSMGKNKKVIGLMNDELVGKKRKEFVPLRPLM